MQAIELFLSSIRSPETKISYSIYFKRYQEFMGPSSSKKKGKSDLDQEPMTWPREKSVKQTSYESFLEEVINPKTGEFYLLPLVPF
jgi:hypothetical protein